MSTSNRVLPFTTGEAPGDAARGIDDAAADAGLGDPEGWRFRSASQRTKRLALRDVLQDAWEFRGLGRLWWFLLYFVYTIVFIGFNWSENAAVFHQEMMTNLEAFGPEDFQQTAMQNQLHMASGFKYLTGYMGQVLKDAQDRNLPLQDLYLNQYIKVHAIRMLVDVDTSCQVSALHCYKTDPIRDSIGAVNGNGTLPSGVWAPFPDTPNLPYAYGNAKYVYVTLFNQSDTSATYGAVEATLAAMSADVAFVGRYAMSFVLELYASFDRQWESDSASYFNIAFTLKESLWSKTNEAYEVARTQSTVPLKSSFLSSFWDALRLILLVLYLVMLATYLAQQYDDARLSAKQYATAARQTVLSIRAGRQKPMADEVLRRAVQERPEAGAAGPAEQAYVAKMVRLGVWRYATSFWNVVDILGTLVAVVWALAWLYIITFSALMASVFTAYMSSPENLTEFLAFSQLYAGFIYLGIANILLVGVRLYKFMRYHRGMRIYYHLFISAWRALKDFGLWFIYVMLVLATVVIMVFQVSGGNQQFSVRADGINSMALLAFGVMDFETFTNGFQGTGSWKALVVCLFWVNMAVLTTIAFNIVIAIVCNAYSESMAREGPVEFTLIYVAWLRLVFLYHWAKRVWLQRWSVERFAQSWVRVVSEEINMDARHTSHEFRYTRRYPWVRMKIAQVYARWSIANLPETQALLNYFQDACSSSICARSPWEDVEAVEEALTSVVSSKRHKAKPPSYQWTIDKAMTRGEFMAFLTALTSSGCVGIPKGASREVDAPAACAALPPLDQAMLHIIEQEAKSKQDPANGSGSDDGAIPTATPDPACRSTLTYQQYLQLAERLDEELAQVDDVMCDLAARSATTSDASFTMSTAKKPFSAEAMLLDGDAESEDLDGVIGTDPVTAALVLEQQRDRWRAEGGAPGHAWAARLSELHASWAQLLRGWEHARALFHARKDQRQAKDRQDIYTRSTAMLLSGGVVCLRRGLLISGTVSESLQPLINFRPAASLGLRKLCEEWSHEKVAFFYAPWVWEVYSADIIADEDWNEEMDDMDLKLVDLKEALGTKMDEALLKSKARQSSARRTRAASAVTATGAVPAAAAGSGTRAASSTWASDTAALDAVSKVQ